MLPYKWTARAEIPFSCFQKSWVEDQSKLEIVYKKCKVRLSETLTGAHVRKEESRSLSFTSSRMLLFLVILWGIFFFLFSRKTIPVKLMFWQEFSSQSRSNPFCLYLSTAFYKVLFNCLTPQVFIQQEAAATPSSSLYLHLQTPLLLPQFVGLWYGAISITQVFFHGLFCAPKEAEVANKFFRVVCFIETHLYTHGKILNVALILMCRYICFSQFISPPCTQKTFGYS